MQQLIFDIGFFKGEDTAYYLKKGYKVVAVDANPLLVEEGKKKFSDYITSGQLTLLNIGMSHSQGILPFYVNGKNLQWSSFDLEIGSRNNTSYKIIDVPTNSVQWLIEQYGMPYYIKIDIEGYDKYVIQGLGRDLPRYFLRSNRDVLN